MLICLLAGGAFGGWLWFGKPSAPPEPETLPPISESPFENTASRARYVGARSCVECHAEQDRSYRQTAHSRALAEIDIAEEPPDGAFEHAPSGRSYRVYRQGGELRQREFFRTSGGGELVLADYAARYVMGSGRFSRSYLIEDDGFLMESPVTWYTKRPGWAISPGYDNFNSGFERPAEIRCVNCHAGRVESIGGSPHRLKIHTLAIDCERCHGPGSHHVERWNSGGERSEANSDFDRTIVHPGRLSRELNEAICAQCHLHSAATVDLRGRSLLDYRPGLPLTDFCVHYGLESPDTANTAMEVVGHVEQMRLSRCYRETESLTCTTCHDPHRKPADDERLAYYRGKCLSCHSDASCGMERAERVAVQPQDDCVTCHMPTSPTEIPHFAFTHHRIGVHNVAGTLRVPSAPESDDRQVKPLAVLEPLSDVSHLPTVEQQRLLGLAYLQLSDAPGHGAHGATYRTRAREILEQVHGRGLRDPEIDAALARLYWQADPQRTIAFAESVLDSQSASPDALSTAYYTLGSSYFQLGRTDLALAPLEQAARRRRFAEVWAMLSVCHERNDDLDAAVEAAIQAARIRPWGPRLQSRLAELYRRQGESQKAREHERLAEQFGRYFHVPPTPP